MSKMETRFHLDGRAITVEHVQDVEPILDTNKELRSHAQKSDWGRMVASVPAVIENKWLNECWERGHQIQYGSAEWREFVWRKLHDPEYAKFRTDSALVQGFMGFGS